MSYELLPLLRSAFSFAFASLGYLTDVPLLRSACFAGWLMFVIVWFLLGLECVILCIFGCFNLYRYDWMGFGGFAAVYFGGLLVQ